jgi:peptidoglycan/xylan/chitin deacetylase (PgdA/CDA1 family)
MMGRAGIKHAAMGLTAGLLNVIDGGPVSWLYGGRGHILMFHRVQPADESRPRLFANAYLEVTPGYLQDTIDYFRRRGYAFIRVEEVTDYLRNDRTGRPFVVYTFDDGYRDNFEFGLPVFRRNDVPFCVNVTTGFPDHTVRMWWNALERLVLSGDALTVRIHDEERTFPTANDAERTAAFAAMSRWLKYTKGSSLDKRIGQLLAPFGIDPLDEVRELAASWDEIRDASREPLLTLGGHTISHPVLAELTEAAAFDEVVRGKQRLEAELGREVTHFAYPYGGPGEISDRDVGLVERAGFASATTTYSSNVHMAHADHPFSLPRIAVGMSMTESTFDLIRHGVIPAMRNGGRRVVTLT